MVPDSQNKYLEHRIADTLHFEHDRFFVEVVQRRSGLCLCCRLVVPLTQRFVACWWGFRRF